MPNNRRRQMREFFERHPTCIFCGGGTPATTRDHVPSRQMFLKRSWPEGFEFPSCEACNAATAHQEQVVAMLARINPDGATETEQKETQSIIKAVGRNYPTILQELRPSARQARDFLKKLGIPKHPSLATSEVPVLNLQGPLVNYCVATFARKLITALHYKHTGKIIPLDGGIIWKWYSNVQAMEGELPQAFISHFLQNKPDILRAKQPLAGEFDYKYGVVGHGEKPAYFAVFRLSFAILGYASMDASKFPDVRPEMEILRPFSPRNLAVE